MSYDIRIYTVEKPDWFRIQSGFPEMIEEGGGFFIERKGYRFVIMKEAPLLEEDIPDDVFKTLPGLQYLVECSIEPITSKEAVIKEMIKISKTISKEAFGVIYNPQTDEILTPTGVKRTLKVEKKDIFSVLALTWWFNSRAILEKKKLIELLTILDKYLPESLPRRYGEYEPPKEKYSDIETFADFLIENSDMNVWYPSKPVDYVNFAVPNPLGPNQLGYRFGTFAIKIDSSVLDMPGWKKSIKDIFVKISEELDAFYGDIYILKNHIRSKAVSYIDHKSERHPITSWWWNGIPKNLGCGLFIGKDLSKYVKVKGSSNILIDGSISIVNESFENIKPDEVNIDKKIIQPTKIKSDLGFSGRYPKIWPFDGPKLPDDRKRLKTLLSDALLKFCRKKR